MPHIHISSSGPGSPVHDWYRHELGWLPCPDHAGDCLRQYALPPSDAEKAAAAASSKAHRTKRGGKR